MATDERECTEAERGNFVRHHAGGDNRLNRHLLHLLRAGGRLTVLTLRANDIGGLIVYFAEIGGRRRSDWRRFRVAEARDLLFESDAHPDMRKVVEGYRVRCLAPGSEPVITLLQDGAGAEPYIADGNKTAIAAFDAARDDADLEVPVYLVRLPGVQ